MSTHKIDALTSAVIVLELCNIFLFTLLLMTPAPKHALVKALIVSCLLRSFLDILPPIVHKIVPQQLGDSLSNFPSMINFCVADSILVRYVTVVKAAFAVSFTLPCLLLALIQVQPKRSADDYPRLTRRAVLALCIAPFLWALPVVVTPIPRLAGSNTSVAANVQYEITSCYFDDPAFTIVSLIFTLVPLAIAIIITVIMGVVVWRHSTTMLDNTGWLFVKTKRFGRFAGLIFVTMISAALYAVVLSLWLHAHFVWEGQHDAPKWRKKFPGLTRANRASVLWEAFTPLLFFLIFAAQEEIYETWTGWLSRLFTFTKHDGRPGDGREIPHRVPQEIHTSRTLPFFSTVINEDHANNTLQSNVGTPALPGKIIARPLSSHFSRRSSHGLHPPPRSGALGSVIAETLPRSPSHHRMPSSFSKGPSTKTFGSYYSTGSQGQVYTGSYGEICTATSGAMTLSDVPTRDTPFRSDTPGSSMTFGRPAGAKF